MPLPPNGLASPGAAHRLVRNVVLNAVGLAIPIVGLLLATPFIVNGFGVERFGILSLAWVIANYFALLDLGVARATALAASEALGRDDRPRLRAILRTSVGYSAGSGLLGSIVMGALVIVSVPALDVRSELVPETRQLLLWLTAGIVPVVMANALLALLEARQRFGVVNLVRIPANLLMILAPAGVAWRGGTLGFVGFLFFLVQAVRLAVSVLVFRREVARLDLSPVRPDDASLRRGVRTRWGSRRQRTDGPPNEGPALLRVAWWLTVANVATYALLYLDRFLVGTMLGVGAVGLYAPSYDLVMRIQTVPGALVTVLFPAFGFLSTREPATARKLLVRSTKLLVGVLAPMLIVLSFFASEFFRWWLDERFATESRTLVPIFAIGVFFVSLAWLVGTFLQATGRGRYVAMVHLGQIPIQVAMTWILIRLAGLEGAAGAWSLRAAISYWSLRLPCRKESVNAGMDSRVAAVLLGLLSAFGLSVAVLRLVVWPVSAPLATVLLAAGASGLGLALWRWVLDHDDREALRSAALQRRS